LLLVLHPHTYDVERSYALDVVLGEFLGLPWQGRAQEREDVEIALAQDPHGPTLRVADGLFATPAEHWLSERSLPDTPLRRWCAQAGEEELPVLYGQPLADGSFYERHERGSTLGVDVFGGVFFQLTRYEELARPLRDLHERFPAEALIASREGFLDRPLADEYVALLWSALSSLFPRLERARRPSAVLLSHDVDWPLMKGTALPRLLKASAADLLKRRDPGMALARLRGAGARVRGDARSDPFNTFELIMSASERHGLRSAFYFMAGVTDPSFDGTYSLADPWIAELIHRIHERGHEVGLHPSYGTFRDPEATRVERDRLAAACERLGVSQPRWGGRQHFLRWENPTTWRNWEQAGLNYDSSLGFPSEPGFRCGTCVEYPVFDLLARRPLELRERPLVAMESALVDRPGASEAQVLDRLSELRERCRRVMGDFTLLWHNSRLASPRERRLYAAALSTICGPA
jgi:hypothetical protein